MYSVNSRSTGLPPAQQHSINQSRLQNLDNTLTPIANAAASLVDTARAMKHAAEARKSAGSKMLFDDNSRQAITPKNLIASLKSAKNALEGVQSKSTGLLREVRHLAAHQEGLYRGNMGGIPLADKVNWCTKQVDNIVERGHKLGQKRRSDAEAAVLTIDLASGFLPGGVGSQNREIISNLDALSRM